MSVAYLVDEYIHIIFCITLVSYHNKPDINSPKVIYPPQHQPVMYLNGVNGLNVHPIAMLDPGISTMTKCC